MNRLDTKKLRLLITILIAATTSGCFSVPYRKLDPRCKAWEENYLADRNSPFILKTDDIETMYEKYICYNSRFHHWTVDTKYLQAKGKETVDLLKLKSETVRTPHEFKLIIFLLRKMQFNNNYNIAEDIETLNALNATLKRTYKEPRGTLSALWLREIEFASPRFVASYPFSDKRCGQWTIELLRLTDKQFSHTLRSLDTNTQYFVLLCKLEFSKGLSSEGTLLIANQGERILPFLNHRLESTDSAHEIILIFEIFMSMHSNSIYNVASNKELLKLLEKKSLTVEPEIGGYHYPRWLKNIQWPFPIQLNSGNSYSRSSP